MDDNTTLTRQQATDGAPGWRLLLGRLHLTVECPTFAEALEFVAEVGRVAEQLDHHPEIDLRHRRVHLAVHSHDVDGLTRRDLRLANTLSELVQRWDLQVQHERLTELEIAIDALDIAAVLPFWEAVTGYRRDGETALCDPDRISPNIWFQQMDEPRPQRNRIHIDVVVPHDEAESRLQRALAAGGHLVSDEVAPRFWILADAEGNEACICTWQGRD